MMNVDTFTQKELSRLFKPEYWDSKTVRDIYYLIAISGLTFDEALDLCWQDIDFSGPYISVRDERKKIRLLPLNRLAADFLQGLAPEVPANARVFTCDYNGEEFYAALEKSGIVTGDRALYPESVRASFLKALKDQGHSQDTIIRVYGDF